MSNLKLSDWFAFIFFAETTVICMQRPSLEQTESFLQRQSLFGSVGASHQPAWTVRPSRWTTSRIAQATALYLCIPASAESLDCLYAATRRMTGGENRQNARNKEILSTSHADQKHGDFLSGQRARHEQEAWLSRVLAMLTRNEQQLLPFRINGLYRKSNNQHKSEWLHWARLRLMDY